MSALDEIREAARLMRERAEAATPGPWEARHRDSLDWLSRSEAVNSNGHEPGSGITAQGGTDPLLHSLWPGRNASANAEHIAGMHPAVALAVAEWMGVTVRLWPRLWPGAQGHALAVARAYLKTPKETP